MVRFLPLAFSLFRSRLKGMVALASRNRKHAVLRMDIARGVLGKRQLSHQSHIEALEPRHLMAANPVAYDDAAFYTNVSTDLVVTTSSSPAHLLANDLDIDGGAITSSVVVGPTSGSIVTKPLAIPSWITLLGSTSSKDMLPRVGSQSTIP
jgi:hypothetical protein